MLPEGWILQYTLTPEFSCDVCPDGERVVAGEAM
jgi:hypothetical protein